MADLRDWRAAGTRAPGLGCRRPRSRSGGMRSGATFRRKNRSSRNKPCWIRPRRSRLVAAMMRTFGRRLVLGLSAGSEPSITRSNRVWASSGSRLFRPERACPHRPPPASRSRRPPCRTARPRPVRAARQPGVDGDELARSRRRPMSRSARATNSLPVPDSSVISTVRSALHQPGDGAIDVLHRPRTADQRQATAADGARLGAGGLGVGWPAQRTPRGRSHVVQVEGFGHIGRRRWRRGPHSPR